MKARFTITNKLILGFGILVVAIILNGVFTYSTLNENQELNNKITSVYNPSAENLQELYSLVNNTQMLAKNWVYIEKQDESPDKKKLVDIIKIDFPILKEKIINVASNWDSSQVKIADSVLYQIENNLFDIHKNIMNQLNSFEKYEDAVVFWEITPKVEDGGELSILTAKILADIKKLQNNIEEKTIKANQEMSKSFTNFQDFILIALTLITLFILLTGFFTSRSIINPIFKLKEFLLTMTKGMLPTEKMETANDEIGDMADALNIYIENMRKTSEFAVEIGKGIYDTKFEALGEEDMLGNALINMKENLYKAKVKNDERSKTDEIRNWITKGLADFGDILRQNSDNMSNLAKNIITKLIDYLEVNQGAMYILNENDETHTFFEMQSAIAYGREKYEKHNYEISEGLVGRCAFEKLPIYLKEIPEDYIRITSGLGGAEPNYLLLVPLVINEKVMGVIEMASFNKFHKYQIEFITTLGENIASTISNVRINEQTKHLLDESKLRGDELSSQEEELRQNMEELQATQEEAARREREMLHTIDAINNTMGTIEIDKHGNMLSINDNFLLKTKLDAGILIGKSFQEMFAASNKLEGEFLNIWASLHIGENGNMVTNYITAEAELWFKHTFTPFKGSDGDLDKVVDLIVDISQQKQLEKELEIAKLSI
ncbi:MAG: GAF domain-containing protein [Salinivirgaceae bacterium]|nr:GAF domain-containing protein [Salinivirgaceae bacterium]